MSDESPGAPAEPAESGSEAAEQPAAEHATAEHVVTQTTAPPEGAPTEAPPATRPGWFVPRWAGIVVVLLLIAGIGFAIGWVAAPGDSETRNASVVTPRTPRTPNTLAPGRLSRAFLGVTAQDATGSVTGAQITNVANGSPAATAGLQTGDVITSVDGNAVGSATQLVNRITAHQPGDQVTITYSRGGTSSQAKVTLTNRLTFRLPTQ